MTPQKEQALQAAYEKFLKLSLGDLPLELAPGVVAENMMAYGTAGNEKMFSLAGYCQMVLKQREQFKGLHVQFSTTPVFRRISANEDMAIIVEEVVVSRQAENSKHEFFLRLTTIMEYVSERWLVVHLHASKADEVSTNNDAWHINEWKKKMEELQQLMEEKTADLEYKNRQLEVEAALERVRAKTMAMHSSADVGNTALAMFDELHRLELNKKIRCGILIGAETERWEAWTAVSTPEGAAKLIIGHLRMMSHPLLKRGYEAWINEEPLLVYQLKGDEVKSYYNMLASSTEYGVQYDIDHLPEEETSTIFYFPEGCLFAFTPEPLPEEAMSIFKRFSSVFALIYRRYMDLQKAEASAKEALKQASLDRMRVEIASMRTSKDLERITPLIWKELTILNVPFIRCGVFIMNKQEAQTNVYLSTPDGQAIAAFQLPFSSSGFTKEVLQYWYENRFYRMHWDAPAFAAWTRSLVREGIIQANEKYSAEKPPENLYLHFLPFTQGMLYVGNTAPLTQEDIQVVQSLADAFSTAYARYEDFTKLDAAKQQIEATLTELKSTQSQLIQKEKMASLGELTAGIAHEIQNPLNFVNNFSEINTELIEELKDALAKNNGTHDGTLEVELLDDIEQNLQKIMHHGKRADSIVKGMLQHSRVNTGQREMTDINALTDEYLRLSYHGLRAKDKTFNAAFTTNFDEHIGKLNIIPQDISRVLLNLFNNAFYAVNEKKKLLNGTYEPKVTVCTKKENGNITIVVKDNGNGIPQQVVDKIFQPFFTTKPTGEGTGLGLSLSYDIIKVHGGEIKVESEEGEGTSFIISLPLIP